MFLGFKFLDFLCFLGFNVQRPDKDPWIHEEYNMMHHFSCYIIYSYVLYYIILQGAWSVHQFCYYYCSDNSL